MVNGFQITFTFGDHLGKKMVITQSDDRIESKNVE